MVHDSRAPEEVDLPGQLRKHAGYSLMDASRPLLNKAADEIERLHQLLRRAEARAVRLGTEIAELHRRCPSTLRERFQED